MIAWTPNSVNVSSPLHRRGRPAGPTPRDAVNPSRRLMPCLRCRIGKPRARAGRRAASVKAPARFARDERLGRAVWLLQRTTPCNGAQRVSPLERRSVHGVRNPGPRTICLARGPEYMQPSTRLASVRLRGPGSSRGHLVGLACLRAAQSSGNRRGASTRRASPHNLALQRTSARPPGGRCR